MNRSQLVAASHANEVLLCVPCLSSKPGLHTAPRLCLYLFRFGSNGFTSLRKCFTRGGCLPQARRACTA